MESIRPWLTFKKSQALRPGEAEIDALSFSEGGDKLALGGQARFPGLEESVFGDWEIVRAPKCQMPSPPSRNKALVRLIIPFFRPAISGGGTWRIIPVNKWLIAMVNKSPKQG